MEKEFSNPFLSFNVHDEVVMILLETYGLQDIHLNCGDTACSCTMIKAFYSTESQLTFWMKNCNRPTDIGVFQQESYFVAVEKK